MIAKDMEHTGGDAANGIGSNALLADSLYRDAKRDRRGKCCVCGYFFGNWISVDVGGGKKAHSACYKLYEK